MNLLTDSLTQALPYLVPVIILELGLLIFGLVDLSKRENVRGGNKIVWVLVMVFVSIIGPVVYLAFGRKEPDIDESY
jgi:hypothetical protein